MAAITFGILTVSNESFNDNSKDANGPEVARLVIHFEKTTSSNRKWLIHCRSIAPNEEKAIIETLVDWSDREKVDVILTTGGTGLSKRDVTPGATRRIIDKDVLGIILAMQKASLKITPLAMLSRAIAGIRGDTLIINLPDTKKTIEDCFAAVAFVISDAVTMISNENAEDRKNQKKLEECGKINDNPAKRQFLDIVISDIANRPREQQGILITYDEATAIIESKIGLYLKNKEVVNVEKSHGRILAERVTSPCNLPPYRASSTDGYAIIVKDGRILRRVLGTIEGGQEPGEVHLHRGQCVRVKIGSPVPNETTAVVKGENTRNTSAPHSADIEMMIDVLTLPKSGDNIKEIGSEIKIGSEIFDAGTKIGAVQMGILAACGVTKVEVTRIPIVGILSIGNELQTAGGEEKSGHVYDSNKIALSATLKECGYDSMDLGIIGDDAKAMAYRLEEGFMLVDVLIITTSIFESTKDMLKPIVKELFGGSIHFAGVNVKPGETTTFGTCTYRGNKKYVLCLSGNPVSITVLAHLFTMPILNGLTNNYSKPIIVNAKLSMDYNLHPKPEYARGIIIWKDSGTPTAHVTGTLLDSKLPSCKSANALLLLPAMNKTKLLIRNGDRVSAMLLGFSADPVVRIR